MLICPKCGYEYREGFETCADCGGLLVDKMEYDKCLTKNSSYDSDILRAMEPILVAEYIESTEAAMLVDILEGEGIPVLTKPVGFGGYMKVVAGTSVYGANLFVDKNHYERAKELVSLYRMNPVTQDAVELMSNGDAVEDMREQNRSGWLFRIYPAVITVSLILMGLMLTAIVLVGILKA